MATAAHRELALQLAVDWAADRAENSGFHPNPYVLLEHAEMWAEWLTSGVRPAARDSDPAAADGDVPVRRTPTPLDLIAGRSVG